MKHWRTLSLGLSIAFAQAGVFAQNAALPTGPSGNYRIAGTVVSTATQEPLARARVTIASVKDRQPLQSVVTKEDGRFEFSGLAAGKYTLEGDKSGFIRSAYDQHDQFSTAIVTGAGVDTEHLVFRLSPAATIHGSVLDEAGEAVRDASVMLYRENHGMGLARTAPYQGASTDDLGTYEFAALPPGTYFVAVSAQPWYALRLRRSSTSGDSLGADRSLDVAYPITFYADATESDEATPILVRSGDDTEIDIHLRPVPALHFVFRSEDEQARQRPLLQKRVFDSPMNQEVGTVTFAEDGTMEIKGVAPGRYSVQLLGPSGRQQFGEVDLSRDGQELDAAGGAHLTALNVAVKIQGEEKIPDQLALGLVDERLRPVAFGRVDDSGRASLMNVPPGTYSLLALSGGKLYSVMRVSSGDEKWRGNTLQIAQGGPLEVSVVLVSGAASVEGIARRDGKPAAGAMVVLVPNAPASNYQFFRRDQSDLDGSFNLRNVAPGAYTVIAIQDGWDLDWSSPGVIAHYAKKGTGVRVVKGAQGTVKLPAAVEVQLR